MTEFRAFKNLARATGESLQEKIDLAMPEAVIDMRFAHYLGEFADDEGFLQATHQAALPVERKKALKQAKEQMRGQTGSTVNIRTEKKEDKRHENRTKPKESHPHKNPSNAATKSTWFGKKDTWGSADEARKGVPPTEKEEYRQDRDGWWHCGHGGHQTYECLAFNTHRGTKLPPATWKVGAVIEGKTRKREAEEDEESLATKQQKVAAMETMEVDALPMWESDKSDF